MGGVSNQLQMRLTGHARLAIVDGKSSQDAAILRGNRSGPTGPQTVRQRQMTELRPQGVSCDVGDDHLLSPVDGRAARSGASADFQAVDSLTVLPWQRGCGAVPQSRPVGIEQQNRAQ